MTATKSRRTEPARPQPAGRIVWIVIGAVLVAALVVAIVLSMGSEDDSTIQNYGTPTVTGTELPVLVDPATDPAVGMPAPAVDGAGFDGTAVTFDPQAGPTALMFLAHWCPHCQDEVPAVQDWLAAGGLPDGARIIAVATGTDPARDNYPPSRWLEREGLTAPVIVDDQTGTVARAFGLPAFPYWVLVDGDGNVAVRVAGSVPVQNIEAALAGLAGG